MEKAEDARIRRMHESDAAGVARLIERTLEVSYAGVYPPSAVGFFKAFHSEAKIRQRLREGEILVVEQAGRAIATGAIVAGEIFGVFVDPDRQHSGLGKALMQDLEARARAQGYEEAVLSVSLPSRRFYESLGYTGFEERSKDLGDGERLAFWQARKALIDADC